MVDKSNDLYPDIKEAIINSYQDTSNYI